LPPLCSNVPCALLAANLNNLSHKLWAWPMSNRVWLMLICTLHLLLCSGLYAPPKEFSSSHFYRLCPRTNSCFKLVCLGLLPCPLGWGKQTMVFFFCALPHGVEVNKSGPLYVLFPTNTPNGWESLQLNHMGSRSTNQVHCMHSIQQACT
jgi:hypothetical protein